MFGLNIFAGFNNGSPKIKLWLIKLIAFAFIAIIAAHVLRTGENYLTKKFELSPEEQAAMTAEAKEEADAQTKDIQNGINDLQDNVKTLQHIVIIVGVILGTLIMLLLWYESRKNEGMIEVLKKTQKVLKTNRRLINENMEQMENIEHIENTKKD